MNRKFTLYIVVALILSFALGACGKKQVESEVIEEKKEELVTNETDSKQTVDEQFLEDVSKALVARWEITDSKEYKDKMAELRESGSTDEREMWRDFVNAELNIMNEGDYKNASFEDAQLKAYALEYIESLEDGLEATKYIISDYDKFYGDWDAAYVKRISVLAVLVNDYGLTVGEDFQANLDELIQNAEERKNEVDQSVSEELFQDNVYTCGRYTITITDYKVIAPGETGNEYGDESVIAFWFDVTNISDDNLSANTAWLTVFRAYQDNDPNVLNELHVGTLPDNQYLDAQMAQIKIGGTVSSAIAYKLTDGTTPVKLVAEDILGGEYGSQDYDIDSKQ